MSKITAGIICAALLLAAFVTISLFVMTETAEAGPTKIEFEVYPYVCKKQGPPIVECLGSPTMKTKVVKVHNGILHQLFDDHPHAYRTVTSHGSTVVDNVLDCSQCSF